jgi:hypothetical protein
MQRDPLVNKCFLETLEDENVGLTIAVRDLIWAFECFVSDKDVII